MFDAISSLIRVFAVIIALVRGGVLPYMRLFAKRSLRGKTYGQRVAMLLCNLGPTFIKFGQSLSARVDIVGEDVAKHLLLLCDRLPPFSFDDVVVTIQSELRINIEDVFLEFDTVPIAAASIAQVHKAKTVSGQVRAVKVLRPGIEKVFRRDIKAMMWLACICNKLKGLQRFRPVQLVEMFSDICKLELDLRFEAANAEELRQNTKNAQEFCVPEVDWDYTARRVLTMQWIDAIPIYEIDKLQHRDVLAKNLLLWFCHQVYRDRFFHADMHPGNIMVDSCNRIVAVDFGIMGRLDEVTCFYVIEIFFGFLRRDYESVAKAHYNAGYVSEKYCDFATACRAIWEPIAGKRVKHVSMAELLAQLFKITADFNMEVQPKLLLLQKTMVLVEGICRQLAPEMDMWQTALSFIEGCSGSKNQYAARLRRSSVYQTLCYIPVLMNKVDKSLDAIVASGKPSKGSHICCKINFLLVLVVIVLVLWKFVR